MQTQTATGPAGFVAATAGYPPNMGKLPEALSSVESLDQVDPAARTVQHWARRALPDGPVSRALSGSWIGHPLHPLLVLAPIGTWVSAAILDLRPDHQDAARRLVLAGLLATGPAMVAGAADLRDLDERQRRTGLVHALANLTASVCYLASYGLRRQGRTAAGRAAAMVGLAAIGAGGALGGHLTYAQGAGVFRHQPERRVEKPPAVPAASAAAGTRV